MKVYFLSLFFVIILFSSCVKDIEEIEITPTDTVQSLQKSLKIVGASETRIFYFTPDTEVFNLSTLSKIVYVSIGFNSVSSSLGYSISFKDSAGIPFDTKTGIITSSSGINETYTLNQYASSVVVTITGYNFSGGAVTVGY